MLTYRRQAILRLLLETDGPLTAAELGRQLDCPAYSVRYDLDALAHWVERYQAQLVGLVGVGYQLEGDRNRLRAALPKNPEPMQEYVLSPKERSSRLLLHLLGKTEAQPISQLAEGLGVGRSTVHGDLQTVERWAQARGLTLERSRAGIRLKGGEGLWRQAMVDLVTQLADEGQLALLLEGHPEIDSLQALLEPLLPGLDWQQIGQTVTEACVPELGLPLAVAVSRLEKGFALPYSPELVEWAVNTGPWRQVEQLAGQVAKRFSLALPSTEQATLVHLLTSSGPTTFDNQHLSEQELDLVKTLAILVQSHLGVVLINDQEFTTGLALHLRAARGRLLRNLTVQNPLLDEVRTKYAAPYRAAEGVADALTARWGLTIPAEEIGYLAMHIAAALERAKVQRQQQPRALLVCGSGIGTAQLLATRLKASLPELQIGRIVSAFRVREALAQEPYDLIIATCQVVSPGVPVIEVSPLLAEGDLAKIRETLREISSRHRRGRQPVLKDVLTAATIALDSPAKDWQEAVRQAGHLLQKAGRVEGRYVEAMVSSVKRLGPYVVLGPGFALPHARPEDGVIELGLSMVRLKEPVNFGHPENDPVDLVFALAAVDQEMHLKALMQLSDLLGNQASIQQLRTAQTKAEVLTLIEQASKEAQE